MFYTFCKNCIKKRSLFNFLQTRSFNRTSNKKNVRHNALKSEITPEESKIASIIQKYEHKLLYSSYVEAHTLRLGYTRNVVVTQRRERNEEKEILEKQCVEPLPLSLKYLYTDENNFVKPKEEMVENIESTSEALNDVQSHFPFELKESKTIDFNVQTNPTIIDDNKSKDLIDLEIKQRLKHLNATNWMEDYENYDERKNEETNRLEINYGTPDPKSRISNVPCGGCGALLHCKDTSIPGYIPSEIYKNHARKGGTSLETIICQRCYFLKNFNLALQVQVSPNEYPQVLRTIREREKALVILIVDLLDFPCSIWPGAADLLGAGRPIFLVGNKVDLLPQDGKGFLRRVTEQLRNSAKESGFATTDIEHVALISAITGFGVEDLITKLHSFWKTQGDVFLVGCTNVGKSSLFNALLQSDYCKSQATDLIQRATVSPWPGTTLNLLKFPILRMSGHRAYLRSQRLLQSGQLQSKENELRKTQLSKTKNPKYATLIGHIGQTFSSKEPLREGGDMFSVKGSANRLGRVNFGVDEKDELYALSKWCCDTPGVVQPEQLLHLLTAEELLLTLSKKLLRPQTFCLHPGSSIFIGGLSRFDYLEGENFARFTVFSSSSLPITICQTDVADELYNEFLGSKFLAVPAGNSERLRFWPGLKTSKEFTVKGVDKNYACADVVLSSSGWISIAGATGLQYHVKAWVPKNCGIYLREPLLPNAVSLRGKRVRYSPAYRANKFYIKN
ncbi:nitric oxide-associated protein 1 [Holotrichia oblita]|uniref:Nitric oxide-associated protein 1 n=1 Tax=Holotrichia oblita TaxID=644536 RepID=A0ACB9T1W3_HOLOL|nr:nitric oxide-associated protein 1 [Holotrichia oblita]